VCVVTFLPSLWRLLTMLAPLPPSLPPFLRPRHMKCSRGMKFNWMATTW
jgi:hypothetical protein